MAKAKKPKADEKALANIARLWKGGERGNARALAEKYGLTVSDDGEVS